MILLQTKSLDGPSKIEANDISIILPTQGDWREDTLLLLHALIEETLIRANQVNPIAISQFDTKFAAKVDKAQLPHGIESGDEPNAPYAFEHCVATGIERVVAALIGVQWKEYREHIAEQPQT